jgi:hypothetical protein
MGGAFILIKFEELFAFLPYFFCDPMIMEQCVVWLLIVCVFSATSFVVKF